MHAAWISSTRHGARRSPSPKSPPSPSTSSSPGSNCHESERPSTPSKPSAIARTATAPSMSFAKPSTNQPIPLNSAARHAPSFARSTSARGSRSCIAPPAAPRQRRPFPGVASRRAPHQAPSPLTYRHPRRLPCLVQRRHRQQVLLPQHLRQLIQCPCLPQRPSPHRGPPKVHQHPPAAKRRPKIARQ